MCVRTWETVGALWRERSSEVKLEGETEVSASGRSGLSRMRRVLRGGSVVVREEMALVSVVLRCARSKDVRV
jgi:hypothetical protein